MDLTKSWKHKCSLLDSRVKQVRGLESKLVSIRGESQSHHLQVDALESNLDDVREELASLDCKSKA